MESEKKETKHPELNARVTEYNKNQVKLRCHARRKRNFLGWTQIEAAAFCGVGILTFRRVEIGAIECKLEVYMRVAYGLGMSVTDMLPALQTRPQEPTSSPKANGKNSPTFTRSRPRARKPGKPKEYHV